MRLKEILFIFILLLGQKGTVYAQYLTLDSCICYTEKQDVRCLECLINEPKKDNIIKNLKEVVKTDSIIIQKHELTVIKLRTDNKNKESKINKLKGNRIKLFLSGLGFGLLSLFI